MMKASSGKDSRRQENFGTAGKSGAGRAEKYEDASHRIFYLFDSPDVCDYGTYGGIVAAILA